MIQIQINIKTLLWSLYRSVFKYQIGGHKVQFKIFVIDLDEKNVYVIYR